MTPPAIILEAMRKCPYKAWQISKLQLPEYGSSDPVVSLAQQLSREHSLKITQSFKERQKAEALLKDTVEILDKNEPPVFYKNPHCVDCQFNGDCLKKLKEKNCISLLSGMTPKVIAKYHNKGVTSITQLSYLFRPRRRTANNERGGYLWELKALAIREHKTFVLQLPALPDSQTAIYIDFEGISDESLIYLLGVFIVSDTRPASTFSFWCDREEDQEENFRKLFNLLGEYPETPIYHYGSYENKALKSAVRKWPKLLKQFTPIEKRMVNLLGYLRTHVYPPIYGNGLKELGAYLKFQWNDPEADGLLSLTWHRKWEETRRTEWKDKLIRYNMDDCMALHHVHCWFNQLNSANNQVQHVAQMKKHTPYHLQHNKHLGDDFELISKAAYFDYQRNKIYWRNEAKKDSPAGSAVIKRPRPGQGAIAWKPKNINETIIIPPRQSCPKCGCRKLYQSHETKSSVLQTDLKFTKSGISQHVREYRSGTAKCSNCGKKTMNQSLRMMHYGDNLFAFVINHYVNYHISNEMISKLIHENYGIWISPMYLVMYKNRWWNKTWEPVATYIKSIVLNSPVIHIDETTIKLSRESGYVWVFATTHSVFYHYASSREVGFLQELLKDYDGIIISDFYPGYETLNVKSQKCLIHLIRDLNDDLFKNQFDEQFKLMVSSFSKLLRKIVNTIDKHGLKKTYLRAHVKDADAFNAEFVNRIYKSDLASKYAKRFRRHWTQLWTFLHYDNVPWNNNNAEAAVKAFAQHRHGVKGQMHVRGITEYLQMLTVAQTCRYRNISFLSFLRKKRGIWENVPKEALPNFLPYDEAKLYVHRLGFERQSDWTNWMRQGNRPPFIPSAPDKTYKDKGWIDWHDWIGFDFLPFPQARTFMRRLHLQSRNEYQQWTKSGQRPKFIPATPEKKYKHTGWVDLNDYLGITKKY